MLAFIDFIKTLACQPPTNSSKSSLLVSNISTVTSPNIARPLTMLTSPSDYATFKQIKSFLIFKIRLLLEREKKAKSYHFMLSLLSRSRFWQQLENVVKKFLTVVSNDLDFKLFTWNQVIGKVNC